MPALRRLASGTAACVLSGAALAAAAMPAHAAIVIQGHDVAAAPGGDTPVVFDFDFGASTEITSFDLAIGYDPTLLTLIGADTSYHGVASDLAGMLAAAGTYAADVSTPGVVSATFFALDSSSLRPLPPLALSGAARLTLHFGLDAPLPAGRPTTVRFDLDASDAQGDPLPHVGAVDAVAPAPVPEPGTRVLAALGLPLLLALARRSCGTTSPPALHL